MFPLLNAFRLYNSKRLRKKPRHFSLIIDDKKENVYVRLCRKLIRTSRLKEFRCLQSAIEILSSEGVECISVLCSNELLYNDLKTFLVLNEDWKSISEETCKEVFDAYTISAEINEDKAIRIRLIKPFEGHMAIQKLPSIIHKNKLFQDNLDEITPDNLDNIIDNFPEPDIIVCTMSFLSLRGYPPWQVKASEIRNFPCLHYVSNTIVHESLRQYSECDRRLGK